MRSDGKLECACIINYRRKGAWTSRKCNSQATREFKVHQENEHPKIGTGWYWVPICEAHLAESEINMAREELGEDWRWVYYPSYERNHESPRRQLKARPDGR